VGAAAENVAEFAGGEAEIKALTSALKVKDIGTVAKLMKQYPWLSKVGIAGMKSFMLGAGQSALHGEEHPIRSGLETAATGMAGETAAAMIEKRGAKAIPKTYDAVNEHIGLKKSDLPKWERMKVDDARDVGKTVLEQNALKGTLEETHVAIDHARDNVQKQTEHMIASTKGRLVPYHADIKEINDRLLKEIITTGQDVGDAQSKALKALYTEFHGLSGSGNMTVQEAMKLRRSIGSQINWNQLSAPGPMNVKQQFLSDLYHDLNKSIENALPTGDAEEFRRLNRTQNRLIIARDASATKIADDARTAAKKSGLASTAATFAKRTAIGTAAGALGGAATGHTKEGVEGGAILGAASGMMGEVRAPRMDVKAEKIIAKAAPRLAAAARKSPALARAIESATAAHGGGTGSISAP
jgi:hypothetical protein